MSQRRLSKPWPRFLKGSRPRLNLHWSHVIIDFDSGSPPFAAPCFVEQEKCRLVQTSPMPIQKEMLKKSGLSSAYSGLQCCLCSHQTAASSSSTSPLALPVPRARPLPSEHKRRKISLSLAQWRSYATVKDSSSKSHDFRDNMNWPCRKSASFLPTPYEIFELEKTAIYTKHRFYELVKIYHPDRHNQLHPSSVHSHDNLTPLQRLERYRLIVQAHEILSDPIKRRAYDTYGAGWGEHARIASRHSRGYTSAADGSKTYGQGPDHDSSPFANATWEDWERWYTTHSPHPHPHNNRPKQSYEGTYVNPNAFASFVILLAVLSGIAQATRAGQYTGSIEEKAAAFTEETNRFLTERAGVYNERKLNSDGRIRHFLEKRDPSRYGLRDEEEETYRAHFGGGHNVLKPEERVGDDVVLQQRSDPLEDGSSERETKKPEKRRKKKQERDDDGG